VGQVEPSGRQEMNDPFDTRMMARALQLAERGQYSAMPNPHVGCVLARDGEVVGEGFTQPAGGNHAEVEALERCDNARGATAYVTLEPCSHRGKTGPCAEALIAAGVTRVVIAMEDPNPQVNGKGVERLRAAGVDVTTGLLSGEARRLIPGFVSRMSIGRPRIRAKLAMSLDGRTAMASGESQWITGPAARADVQRLRAMSCAIITGVGTVVSDDCSLTVRAQELGLDPQVSALAARKQPLRVVLDSRLRTPRGAKILGSTAPTALFHAMGSDIPEHLQSLSDQLQGLNPGAGGLDLHELVGELSRRQCNEIQVESRPRLAGAILQAGLLDELNLYMAPLLMGDRARPLLELPLDSMSEKVQLQIEDVRKIGEDFRVTARPIKLE